MLSNLKKGIIVVGLLFISALTITSVRAEELKLDQPCLEKEQFISTGLSQFIKPPCAKILPAPDYLATEILTPELPEAFIYQYRKPRITRVVDTPNPAMFQCVYLHPCLI